ncbi:MAG: PHP domain-containing protein, partial [Planctomycetota bacterium]|nr:PHP domain-containing protein [Planctomycetota bacterium]
MTEAPPFVHLHVRSHYSLLTAPAQVGPLVAAAKEDGQTALALTDNGNMFGAVDLYKACEKAGIKPILGQTTYYAGRTSKETAGADNPTFDLTLIAENNVGFENLKRLSGKAWLEGFSYRPR